MNKFTTALASIFVKLKNEKIKSLSKKMISRWSVAVFLLIIATISGFFWFKNHQKSNENPTEQSISEVKTLAIGQGNGNSSIEAIGKVKAKTKIDVVAMTGGTLKNIYFQVGNEVKANQLLASISSPETAINLLNSETFYASQRSNLAATRIISDQTKRQAELGTQAAEETVLTAEIGLKNAQENLKNAGALRQQSIVDTKNNSVISFNTFLNTIDNALDQANLLLDIDDEHPNNYLDQVLGAKNLNSLSAAKSSYAEAMSAYNDLASLRVDNTNISSSIASMSDGLRKTKKLSDDIITLLDDSATSGDFTEADLYMQKNTYLALRSGIISALSGSENAYQALTNLNLIENQEIDALENAVEASEKQLAMAMTNLKSAQNSLEIAKNNTGIQENGAETAVSSAGAQLNLMRTTAGDLNVKAPINGVITGKYAEIGAEIMPGSRIAELSQIDMVTIEIELTAEDASRINSGQAVTIDPKNKNLAGTISRIYPTADPVNKKVKIEIIFNNKNNDLIPESYAEIVIPADDQLEEKTNQPFIPLNAVTITSNGNYVFIAIDSAAKQTAVELGEVDGESVAIKSGLQDNDLVIIDGNKQLKDGDKIKIIK
jgi:membrane fusion protein, multidrug efflux system